MKGQAHYPQAFDFDGLRKHPLRHKKHEKVI